MSRSRFTRLSLLALLFFVAHLSADPGSEPAPAGTEADVFSGPEVALSGGPTDRTDDLGYFRAWYPYSTLPPFDGAGYDGRDLQDVIYAGNARFVIGNEPRFPEDLRSPSGLGGTFVGGYWIIHFREGVDSEIKADLDLLTGGTRGPDGRDLARWYIPNRALIAWVDSQEVLDHLLASGEVDWLGPYHPAYKISPFIGLAQLTSPERVGRSTYLLNVDLIPGHSATIVKGALVDRGIRVVTEVYIPGLKTYDVHYIIVEALPHQVMEVARIEGVRMIQETGDGLRRYDLSGGGKLQNRTLSVDDGTNSPIVTASAFPLWLTHNLQGQGQLIGVVDTSLDWNNVGTTGCANGFPDLAISNYGFADPVTATLLLPVTGTGGVSLKVPRADELGGATLLGIAANEHGCGVAGAALADFYGNDSTKFWEHDVDVWETWTPSNFSGLLGPGIAHEAQLYFTPVMDSVDAFRWEFAGEFPTNMGTTLTNMANAGVCTTNHSVGLAEANNTYTQTTLVHDTKGFDHLNMLQCMAAGNDGAVANAMTSQSVAKNILAVGASDDVLKAEDRVTFSSIGPRFDGALKPEIMAPGSDTFARTSGVASALILPDTNGAGGASCSYQFTQGTSFSSPIISGAGALVHQYFQEGRYPGADPLSDASSALIRATLINAGERMTGANLGDNTYPNDFQGWGEPNLSAGLDFGTGTRKLYVQDIAPAQGFPSAASPSHSYNVNVTTSAEPLKITLSWMDEPGSIGTAKQLINDLHLTATSPTGTVYLGNDFNGAAGQSTTGGLADTLNTTESVIRLTPELGSWTFSIDPFVGNFSVNQGYALVVTGGITVEPPDCNNNGIPDVDDIAAGATDCNGNGVPDECEPDCNGNGIADACDLTSGFSADCNSNLVPDECDISLGTSQDCDGDGVPDECQIAGGASDCNLNDQLDSCDIVQGISFDCDNTGVLDECEALVNETHTSTPVPPTPISDTLPPAVDTIAVGSSLTVIDLDVGVQITHTWTGDLSIVLQSPAATSVTLKAIGGGNFDNVNVIFDDEGVPYVVGDLALGLSMQPETTPLSVLDGENSSGTWTLTMTDTVGGDNGTLDLWSLILEGSGGAPPDCDADGIPDACETDCNINQTPDDCDISSGTSTDDNNNGIPDECEAGDCNNNGIPDDQDIANGTESDCDVRGAGQRNTHLDAGTSNTHQRYLAGGKVS
ncbi:MAG TPA: hypothetical protein EYN79_02005, partial [Planctomycetes bacterium]|nr:hypothetical protein [Planctomycetota bacterium]